MNGAHLHLLVNHIPVFAVAFGGIALAWAMARRSNEMCWASVALFVLGGISALIADKTGDSAEEVVEHLAGVTKALIHAHEEAAEFALVSAAVLAAGALVMAAVARYRPRFLKPAQILVLLLSVFSSVLMARTAYLGGQIRHTEIRDGASISSSPSENSDTGEKDD